MSWERFSIHIFREQKNYTPNVSCLNTGRKKKMPKITVCIVWELLSSKLFKAINKICLILPVN